MDRPVYRHHHLGLYCVEKELFARWDFLNCNNDHYVKIYSSNNDDDNENTTYRQT